MPVRYEEAPAIIAHYNIFKTMPGEDTKLFLGIELEIVFKRSPSWNMPQIGTPQPNGPAVNPAPLNSLELDVAVTAAAEWTRQRLAGHVILKPEHANGFEIVTCPASLAYHRSILWNGFFQEASELLEGRPGCGLHIHFSRDAVTEPQLARITYFYHEPANYQFLTAIAGRTVDADGNCYNKALKKTFIPGDPAATIRELNNHGRHTSIAANTPLSGFNAKPEQIKNTLEVRIFQSKVDRNHVMQALEFVHALNTYMERCPDIESELTAHRFLQWFVETNQMINYPYLYVNLMDKELIVGSVDEGRSILQKFFFKRKSALCL